MVNKNTQLVEPDGVVTMLANYLKVPSNNQQKAGLSQLFRQFLVTRTDIPWKCWCSFIWTKACWEVVVNFPCSTKARKRRKRNSPHVRVWVEIIQRRSKIRNTTEWVAYAQVKRPVFKVCGDHSFNPQDIGKVCACIIVSKSSWAQLFISRIFAEKLAFMPWIWKLQVFYLVSKSE